MLGPRASPLRCGSRSVSANTSRHSWMRSNAAESTTKMHPCTSAMYAFQMPRMRFPPPRSNRSMSNRAPGPWHWFHFQLNISTFLRDF